MCIGGVNFRCKRSWLDKLNLTTCTVHTTLWLKWVFHYFQKNFAVSESPIFILTFCNDISSVNVKTLLRNKHSPYSIDRSLLTFLYNNPVFIYLFIYLFTYFTCLTENLCSSLEIVPSYVKPYIRPKYFTQRHFIIRILYEDSKPHSPKLSLITEW